MISISPTKLKLKLKLKQKENKGKTMNETDWQKRMKEHNYVLEKKERERAIKGHREMRH